MSLDTALKDPDTGNVTVPAHTFGGAVHLWAEGLITRDQFLAGTGMPEHAHADIDALATAYANKTSAILKLAYVLRAERVAILLQTGAITAAQFRTFMELS